jgi:hypothetical protein
MKIKDILLESNSLNEAPVGMLKRAGLGIASKLGSQGAGGKLDTANVANQLKKDFTRYVGTLWNRKPDAELLVQWLQSKGYPTDGVEKMLAPVAQNTAKPDDQAPPEQGGGNTPPEQGAEPEQPGTDFKALDKPAYQRQNKTIPGVNAPEIKPAAKSAAQVNAAKASKSKKTPSWDKPLEKKPKTPNRAALLKPKEGMNEAAATLSGSQIDKAMIQAVSDAAAAGGGASSGGGDLGSQAGGGGGAASKFFQGVKKGLTGQGGDDSADQGGGASLQGNVNYTQLAQLLPGVDPKSMQMVINRIKQGKEPSVQQMAQLGSAFVALLKADPQSKQAAINLLKKMQSG